MARPRITRKAIVLPSTDVARTGLENLAMFNPDGTPFPFVTCEITDVYLGEGTDLSSTPLLIGKPFDWSEGKSAIGVAMLILEDVLPAGDDLTLEIDDDEAASNSLAPMVQLDSTDAPPIKTSGGVELRPPGLGGGDELLWGPAHPWYVHLWSQSPLTADVHIVRARVSYFFM